jgi:hypothetical protein
VPDLRHGRFALRGAKFCPIDKVRVRPRRGAKAVIA